MIINDTITALATVPGISGIAVIRMSGDDAVKIVSNCFRGSAPLMEAERNTIHFGKIYSKNYLMDSVLVSVFRNPHSYTGEDTIEISCHGGNTTYSLIIDELISQGARQAEPGEFTKRAFINGKLDLLQAEAVSDMIHSVSVSGSIISARQLHSGISTKIKKFRQILLDACSLVELDSDFSDEDIEIINRKDLKEKAEEVLNFCTSLIESFNSAKIFRSGFYVAIAGFPNSGKSTLFNSLLGRNRAIVSQTPGTTRDYLEESILVSGVAVKLFDTAGLRETEDAIEIEGINFSHSVLSQANIIFVLNDISISEEHSDSLYKKIQEDYLAQKVYLIQNKVDRLPSLPEINKNAYISAKYGEGLPDLFNIIRTEIEKNKANINDILINERHLILLKGAAEAIRRAISELDYLSPNEIIAIELHDAARYFGEMTGQAWNEEVLNNIFSKFCIGK
ncbi:MAG: tRNA uridine-5-carboxymethylaminomethyl(34) synthesis GTPase MnmE [Candidatus Kapabacteria bacterium]|nr:tRNA uridine-5-carboxymethylaminomethyl(34) synthesis GTPase MnmE [Candidatus Kapabacteria bacterium]